MDQLPANSTHSSDGKPTAGNRTAEAAAEQNEGGIKRLLVNLLPPATVVAVVMFWGLAPQAVLDNPWTLVVATVVTLAFVLALEWVFERHAGWRMTWTEFATDFFYVILSFTVIAWMTEVLAEAPLRAAKASLGISTEWLMDLPFIVQAALVLFLIEFGQYWMHRVMHNWHPFWLTHAPHHHITQLNAMKGYVGNPIELFLISLSIVALLDFDTAAIFCALNVLAAVSTYAHANVSANPPLFYSFFFTTIRHHSLHHSTDYESTRCNYANSLIIIDRVLGTYREGEASVVGQDERKRLSIWEQFMFPFQPMIDRIKAKHDHKTHKAH